MSPKIILWRAQIMHLWIYDRRYASCHCLPQTSYFHTAETLPLVHLLKKSPASYATWRFINVFTRSSTGTYPKPYKSIPHDSFCKIHFNSTLSPTSLPFHLRLYPFTYVSILSPMSLPFKFLILFCINLPSILQVPPIWFSLSWQS